MALNRAAHGLPDATWASLQSEPAEPLPSDPRWAGEIVYTDVRDATTTAAPEAVWKATERAINSRRWYSLALAPRRRHRAPRWRVAQRTPTTLRLGAGTRVPGPTWLEVTLTPRGTAGSSYHQRAIFFPRGIPGRLSWLVLRHLHAAALRALARDVTAADR